MRERLRKVPRLAARCAVVFLGQETKVVSEPEQPPEESESIVVAAQQVQTVGHPERTRQEGALTRLEPVHRLGSLRAVPQHQAVLGQLSLDSFNGRADPVVCDGQEPDQGDQQEAGVQLIRPVVLRERTHIAVVALGRYLFVDLLPQGPPGLHWPFVTEFIDHAHGPVHRHPGHDLGVGELPPRTAHLPDTFVGLAPRRLDELHQLQLETPGRLVAAHTQTGGLIERGHDLAVHVELVLVCRRVPNPHGSGILVSG